MTNAYCNMSAPPRSRVHKEVRTIGSHIVFDLAVLSGLSERPCDNELTCWLRKFESRHGDALAAVARPTGYMIAVPLPKAIVPESVGAWTFTTPGQSEMALPSKA